MTISPEKDTERLIQRTEDEKTYTSAEVERLVRDRTADLQSSHAALHARLAEAEETLGAIRRGEIDAILASTNDGEKVFTLRSAEYPYRAVVEQMQEGAVNLAADGTILYCNRSFARLLREPPQTIVGQSIRQYIPGSDQERFSALWKRSRDGRRHGEVLLKARGRDAVPVSLSINPLRLEEARVFSVVVTDLTERKRAERALQHANSELEKRVQERTAELTRSTARLQEAMRQAQSDAEEITTINEELRLSNEELNRINQALSDTNEALLEAQKHAETQHQRAEFERQRYYDLFEAAPEGYLVTDRNGTIAEVNVAAASLLAIHPASLAGRNLIQFIAGERSGEFLTRLARAAGGETQQDWEAQLQPLEGAVVDTAVSIAPLRPGEDRQLLLRWTIRDVTERKRAEDALRESEERYRAFFNNSIDALLITVPDGGIEAANAAACQLFGMTEAELIAGGRNAVVDLLDPRLGPALEERARTGRFRGELNFKRRDGTSFPVAVSSAIFTDRDGRAKTVMILRDITEHKRLEQALRRSEERQAFLLRLSDTLRPLADPVQIQGEAARILGEHLDVARVAYGEVTADDACIIVERNYVAPGVPLVTGRFRMADYGPDLLSALDEGRTIVVADIPSSTALSEAERAGYASLGIASLIGVPLIKGGRFVAELVVHHTSPRQWTGDEIRLMEATAERTWSAVERARAETAHRESEERLRAVVENSLDAVYRRNLQTDKYDYMSPVIEQILGFTAEEMQAMRIDEVIDRMHPDERRPIEAAIAHAATVGRGSLEYRFRAKDGHYRWLSDRFTVIRDAEGHPLFRGGVVRDVTESKRADAELKEYAERLKQSNEDLERFAYISSHDLQEPLRTMVTFSQLLDRRYRGRLDKDADEYLHYITGAGRRMQRLITDLLEFSRVNTKGAKLRSTDATTILEEALAFLHAKTHENGAEVTCDPLPMVMADAVQLRQVFQNLIGNAIKFRRPDVHPAIHISAERRNGMVQFSVADNGIGIEPQYYEKIFVIFQRLHGQETYEGTGIGLALVKRIVERHGGGIWVESEPGNGTTFHFTLPAAA